MMARLRQLFFVSTCVGVIGLLSCQSSEVKNDGSGSSSAEPNQYRPKNEERPLVDEKYSIAEDRKKFEELRKEVPSETKKNNDEIALFLNLLTEVKIPPSEVRNKFDRIVRKKRDLFNKDLTREREVFTREERKKRESFLSSLEKERKEFLGKKPARDEKQDFVRDQDLKRTQFFADEREKRNDFESDVRERRKSFEDYAREKTDQFNQEYRSYSKRYEEKKKLEQDQNRDKDKSAASPESSKGKDQMNSFLEEFLEMEKKPGQPLESGK